VSFELFGQLHGIIGEQPGDREAYFAESVRRWAAQLGITPAGAAPAAHTPAGARLAQTAANAGAINSNASQIAEEANT
jgi:hypothetical protein